MENYFEEVQKLNRILTWVVCATTFLLLGGISLSGIYIQIIKGSPFGNNPMSDEGLILFAIISTAFSIGLFFLFNNLTLETKIDKFGIHYRFFPFIRKWRIIYKEDITEWEVKRTTVLRHGMSLTHRGQAFKMNGDRFLSLVYRNGKKILLGTQKPEEMNEALSNLFNRNVT